MGGRGASSNLKPSVGGGSKSKWSPFGVGDKIPESGRLRESIGHKGKPYSIDNALKNANPNHNFSYSEYSENCQRVVVAYELRRRGYNVTALPTYQGDVLSSGGRWMGAFRGAKTEKVGGKTAKKTQQNLENKMKSYGNGARAVVRIPGHVFNCENKNGEIIYVEAQIGKRYTSKDVFSNLSPKSLSNIGIVRTDNLRLSDRAHKSVKLLR